MLRILSGVSQVTEDNSLRESDFPTSGRRYWRGVVRADGGNIALFNAPGDGKTLSGRLVQGKLRHTLGAPHSL